MTRYFPEVVQAVKVNLPPRCVVDAEIVVPDAEGRRLDFDALLLRIHPAASRVALLAAQTPARLVAFDLLALDEVDWMAQPFARRRAALEDVLSGVEAPVHLTPATTDRTLAAEWLSRVEGAGLDGIIAKSLDGVYEPDRRSWRKVKHTRTADCVVAGYRLHKRGQDLVGSLLLGLYTGDGELAMAGVIGVFPMERRRELFAELQPLRTTFEGHPWDWGAWQRDAEAEGRPGAGPTAAAGTLARSCRSCRCGPSGWSRSAGSATPPSSCTGAPTAAPAPAPTTSSRRPLATTSPTSWRLPRPDRRPLAILQGSSMRGAVYGARCREASGCRVEEVADQPQQRAIEPGSGHLGRSELGAPGGPVHGDRHTGGRGPRLVQR
jgi:ATP dependent DNA ligase-like protein